jgi:pyruvate dehydrogenase E2 component (dihydrolipoamide acetyltransferase)
MASEFTLPALGADMDAGTIVEWHVAPGDRVKRGDVVAVVETDKGAIDVEIFEDGVVREIVVPVGVKVAVGTVLAHVDPECQPADAPPAPVGGAEPSAVRTEAAPPRLEGRSRVEVPTATPVTPVRARVSPAARRRAQELGVDVGSLRGTGADGAITFEDVERSATRESPDPRASMRAAIASAMSRSKREIPHYYLSTSVDVTPVTAWLAARNAQVSVARRRRGRIARRRARRPRDHGHRGPATDGTDDGDA